MPIVRDASGHSKYVSTKKVLPEDPEVFFKDDPDEYAYAKRIEEARFRVIEIIRFHERPLCGRGLNHDMKTRTPDFAELAVDIDRIDGRRMRRARQQRLNPALFLTPGDIKVRIPQDVKKRRSAIFSANDFPEGYFHDAEISEQEIFHYVEKLRLRIIEAAIVAMWESHEIEHLNGIWQIKVTVLDRHVADHSTGRGRSTKVKRDDRSFHGKPNRDRKKKVA